MKQFLRHIFLLALFMATISAWAECYLYENKSITIRYDGNDHNDSGTFSSTEYSLVDDNGVFIGGTMTFKYDLSGGTNASYWHKLTIQGYTGSTWQDIWDTGDIYNKDSKTANIGDISSWKNYSKIRFKRTAKKASLSSWSKGERDINVTSLYITRLTSISPDSASYSFGSITVGESTPIYDFTFNYSNVGTNFVVSSKNSSPHFSIKYISDVAPNACEGSAKYRVTYNPQFGGSHDEIYTITCKDGDVVKGTVTISVTGSAKGYPQHTWYGKDTYNVDDAAIDLDDIWDSNNEEFNTITYSIPETDGFVPSGTNNEGAVKPYIDADNKLYLGQAGTLHLVMHQIATDGFYEKTSTKTITINKYNVEASISQSTAVWNEIIDNPFSLSYGLIDFDVESKNTNIADYHKDTKKIQTYFTDGTAYFQITSPEDYKYNKLDTTLTLEVNPAGGCDVLTTEKNKEYKVGYHENYDGFDFNLNGVGNTISLEVKRQDQGYGYIHVIGYDASGNNETNIASIKYDEMSDSEWRSKTYTIDNENIRKITIRSGHNIWDDALNKYFQNVQVTRKAYLRPSTTELTLPQTNIGKSSENTFNLSWSTCSDDIKLVSNNDLFEVRTTQINTTAHTGTTNNILVRFKGANEPGTYSAVITIYDQSQSKEVKVSCVVKDRLATTIVYTGETQYSEAQDCIEGKFSVEDENGNTVTGANIVLTSSNNDILEICDNAGFMPHCGGPVTLTANYAGDEIYAPAEWSREITVANCYQTIDWEQDFRQFIAAEDGTISQRIELTAKADSTDFAITYELDEAAQKFARLENQDGKCFLVISGVGTGHIIASAPSGTYETKYYDAASLMHEIRVRKWGDKCNTDEMVASDEITLSAVFSWFYDDEEVIGLDGRPYERMEFYSHVSSGSGKNELTVSFSADGGATWGNSQTYTIPETYDWNTPYIHANVPEGANQVKFKTTSTGMTYFNMVKMVQKTYLEPNVTEIRIDDAIVNQPFSREFKVKYSDIPLLQYVISDSHDLGLKLTSTPAIANDCGDWGEYTFTLTGESPYPQENVTETITFYTSAGDEVKIPVTITANLSDTYYFQQAGNWGDLKNWQVNGATPTKLPTASNPIVIFQPLTINEGKLVAYGVTIENAGSVNIQPQGGLTLHAGGFTNVTENNFEVHNNLEGAGFVRVSKYFKKLGGTMPKIKVHFTTKANMNNGENKDAAWQYIGAPGSGVGMGLAHTTVLYLRSEEKGWVRQWTEYANLQAFAGYALTQKEQVNFTLYPTLINEDQDIVLTYTDNGMKGDNLWANSYPAPLDVTKIADSDFTEVSKGSITKTFYVYNAGSWKQWQEGETEGTSANGGDTPGRYYAIPVGSARALDVAYDQTVIPPMQGVYMVAKEGGGTLHLSYERHVWNNTQSDMNRPLRAPQRAGTQQSDFQRIRLQITSENSGADRMYIIQDSTTTADYDNGYDAPKQMTDGLVNIYTNEHFGKMEISSTNNMDSMFIGFMAGEDNYYSMIFTSLIGEQMYLHDLEQDSLFLINEQEKYVFYAEPNSVNDMRFQLLLNADVEDGEPENDNSTTGMDNVNTSDVLIWVHNKKAYVANAPANSTLAVYTASGMCVASPYTIHHTPYTLDLSHLPMGVYILRLNNQAYKFVCK